MIYKVDETFLSVQGEGFWVGTPMVFVRLSGCNLNCEWCDTQQDAYCKMSDTEILERVRKLTESSTVERVCITGGEPTLQDLHPLADALCDEFLLHLETNGTNRIDPDMDISWITVSPKFPPGLGRTVQRWGNELKVPVWSGIMDRAIEGCSTWGHFTHRYLQPVDNAELVANAERCLALACKDSSWSISMQGHKRLGIK